MTFDEYKAAQSALEAAFMAASTNRAVTENKLVTALGIPSRGAMNLIAEPIRLHPSYRAAKAAQDSAFKRLQEFNRKHTKKFGKEIKADIAARRAAKLESAQ